MANLNSRREGVRPIVSHFSLMIVPIALLLLSVVPVRAAGLSTFDVVSNSVSCNQSRGALHCKYKAGTSLSIEITGIGEKDVGIYIYKSDFDGDYFAVLGVGQACITVRRGKSNPESNPQGFSLDMAHISPQTGKVYRTVLECQGITLERKY